MKARDQCCLCSSIICMFTMAGSIAEPKAPYPVCPMDLCTPPRLSPAGIQVLHPQGVYVSGGDPNSGSRNFIASDVSTKQTLRRCLGLC